MTTAVLTIPQTCRPTPTRKRTLGITVSLLVHAGTIGLMLLWKPLPLPHMAADQTLIYLDIEPIVLRPTNQAVAPASSDSAAPSSATSAPMPRIPRNLPTVSTHSTRPSSSSEGADPISPRSTSDRWQYRLESPTAAVARASRTAPIGCAYPERLSEGERAICAEKATDRAMQKLEEGQRITGTGNARRDAALEAEARDRATAYNFRRRPITVDDTGNGRPSDITGSNFGLGQSGRHLDPSMQPDAYGPIQTYRRDGRPEERNVTAPR